MSGFALILYSVYVGLRWNESRASVIFPKSLQLG